MQREDQPKYQTIVFQKQNGIGTQEFHSRYPPPYAPPPHPSLFPPSVLVLLRHSRPMVAPGIPKTAGSNTNFTKHTLTHVYTHERTSSASIGYRLGNVCRLGPVCTWHETSRGFPSLCSMRDDVPVWVYWKCLGYMALGVFLFLSL